MTTPHKKPRSASCLTALAVALCAADLLSCFAAPETCQLCNENLPDGSTGTGSNGSGGTAQGSTGGVLGSGGQLGDAGHPGSGGTAASGGSTGMAGRMGSSGGTSASGGSSSGGAPGTGGAAAGGRGGAGAAGGTIGNTSSGGAGGRGVAATGGSPGSGGAMGGNGVASGGSGGGGAGGRGSAGNGGTSIDPDLVLWYKFDESSGTTAADSAMFGGTARNGTLTNVSTGTASFSTTAKVGSHALSLTGTSSTAGGYVSLPSLSTVAPTALTVACWIYLTADRSWQRVFDFGKVPASGAQPTSYLFLTMHQTVTSPASMRFAITTAGGGNEQAINMSTPAVPSLNAWHHVAVTLGAGTTYTGTLYLDHAVAGTNTGMSHHWSDVGATDQNSFGRSLYAGDQYFAGMLDDCRVYRRALSAAEITALP